MNIDHNIFKTFGLWTTQNWYYFIPAETTKNSISSVFNDEHLVLKLEKVTIRFLKVGNHEHKAIDIQMLKKH